MRSNDVHKICKGVIKLNNEHAPHHDENSYKPSLMTDRKLKAQLCNHSHTKCIECEIYGWCEYGKEAVKRFGKEVL